MQSGNLRNSLQSALQGLSQCVTSISASESNRNVIIVTFILRNRQTNLQLEIQQLEGGVRATGLLCLLGVGIGLGSVVIYRLYTTLATVKTLEDPTPRVRRPISTEFACLSTLISLGDSALAATPDSGIAADVLSTERVVRVCRRYSESGLTARRASGFNQISDLFDGEDEIFDLLRERRGHSSATVEDWLARTDVHRSVNRSHSYYGDEISCFHHKCNQNLSLDKNCRKDASSSFFGSCRCCNPSDEITCFHNNVSLVKDGTTDRQPCCRSSGFLSTDHADADCDSLNTSECNDRQTGYFVSGGVMHRVGSRGFFTRSDGASGGSVNLRTANSLIYNSELKRRGLSARVLRVRRLSFSSQISAGGVSDCSYHESLVSKGFSVDLGEDLLAGMITPPECGDDARIGFEQWNESSMEKLHEELRMIQSDIDEMNERVGGLQSREAISYTIIPSEDFCPNSSFEDRNADLMRFSPMKSSQEKTCEIEEINQSQSVEYQRSQYRICDNNLRKNISCNSDLVWDDTSDLELDLASMSQLENSMMSEDTEQSMKGTNKNTSNDCSEINGDKRIVDASGHSADFYIDDDLIDIRCSPVDELMIREEDLISGNQIFDWFDVEGDWDCCDSRGESLVNQHQQSINGGDPFDTRRLRNTSSGILQDCCHNRSSKRRDRFGSSGSSSRLTTSERNSMRYCTYNWQSSLMHSASSSRPSLSSSSNRPNSSSSQPNSSSVRSNSGKGFQSSPALTSHPCSSTPIASVKPITDSASLPCCHMYSMSANVVPRSAVGWVVENIGPRLDAYQRIEREEISQAYRQRYRQLLRLWNKSSVKVIRADMYCCVRAVLYQALLHQLPILSAAGSLDSCYQKLSRCMSTKHQYLNEWNFANRLPFAKESIQMKLAECLHALYEQYSAASSITTTSCREDYLMSVFNRNPDTDLRLLEAVKVLMMLRAISLYEDFATGRSMPSFVTHLFTRETSRSTEQFFSNHINSIGDTSRIGQVEMCLLGHTLGVCIQLGRPHCIDATDPLIISHPDESERYDFLQVIEENTSGYYSVPTSN